MDFLWPLEKHPVIIQFGQCFTKVGLASEATPRAVLRTPEFRSKVTSAIGHSSLGEEDWFTILIDVLQRIFYSALQTSPRERSVVLLENPFMPHPLRDATLRVLFEKFYVPSVTFLSEVVCPLYTSAVSTGIVIDIGYTSARVLPVCFGCPLHRCLVVTDCAGQDINRRLKKLVLQDTAAALSPSSDGSPLSALAQTALDACNGDAAGLLAQAEEMSDVALEELKVRCCYVRYDLPGKGQDNCQTTFESNVPLIHKLSRNCSVIVSAKSRWKACEALVARQDEEEETTLDSKKQPETGDTIVEAVIASLESCEVDARRMVVQNILFCGGTAELRGLLPRFALELRQALRAHPTLSHLEGDVAFGTPQFTPFLRQWSGASIVGAQDFLEEYSFEHYVKETPLRDWLAATPPISSTCRSEKSTPLTPTALADAAAAAAAAAAALVSASPNRVGSFALAPSALGSQSGRSNGGVADTVALMGSMVNLLPEVVESHSHRQNDK